MKCPFCSFTDSKVVDSRPDKGGAAIRRRRECESCGKRFTTHERIEEILPLVLKKDGRREPFDRMKVIAGIQKACEKRPVSVETIEKLLDKRLPSVSEHPRSAMTGAGADVQGEG